MDTKRIAIATVAGGFTMFAVGYLIWDVVFNHSQLPLVRRG